MVLDMRDWMKLQKVWCIQQNTHKSDLKLQWTVKLMYIQCSDGDDGEGEVDEEEEVKGSHERSMEGQEDEEEEEEQRGMRRHHEDNFTRKLERWLIRLNINNFPTHVVVLMLTGNPNKSSPLGWNAILKLNPCWAESWLLIGSGGESRAFRHFSPHYYCTCLEQPIGAAAARSDLQKLKYL